MSFQVYVLAKNQLGYGCLRSFICGSFQAKRHYNLGFRKMIRQNKKKRKYFDRYGNYNHHLYSEYARTDES